MAFAFKEGVPRSTWDDGAVNVYHRRQVIGLSLNLWSVFGLSHNLFSARQRTPCLLSVGWSRRSN